MLRSRCLRTALASLALALLAQPALSQSSPAPTMPAGGMANWTVLLLSESMVFTRVGGSQTGPFFVFAGRAEDGRSEFLAYRGGAEAPYAFGALVEKRDLKADDEKTLTAFALDTDLKAVGTWDELTFGDGYVIAADPAMGELGDRLYELLLGLETGTFAATLIGQGSASSKDVVTLKQDICALRSWAAFEATDKVVSGAAASGAFPKVASVSSASRAAMVETAHYCGGVSAIAGVTPAFPVFTPPIYPTGIVPWEKDSCPTAGTVRVGCMQLSTGNYCTECICQEAGLGNVWVVTGNCAPVTPTLAGTACAPNGGKGPCFKSGTTLCDEDCTCKAGVWKCGSAELAALFLLAAGGLAWHRQKTA